MINLKAAVIADLHMRPKDLESKRAALIEAVRQAKGTGATFLVLAGDIMDSPSIGGREASVGSVEGSVLEAVEEFEGHVIAIAGNHDLPGPAQGDALTFLRDRNNVTVVSKFTVAQFGGVNFAFIPWTTKAHLKAHLQKEGNADQLETVWEQRIQNMVWQVAELPRPKVVVAHCDINGSMANKYSLIGGSFEFTKAQLIQMDADLYLMGHIHQRQHFLEDNAQYVGALTQNNHGEEANPTGFTSFFFEEDQDPLRMDSKFHHVKSPRYWTITSTEGLEEKFIKPGDHVKVRAKVSEIPAILKIVSEIDGLHVTQDRLRDDQEKVRRTEQDFAVEDDPLSLLRSYMEERGDLEPGLNPDIAADIFKPFKERLALIFKAGMKAASTGRLDRILSIRLQNIGRHKDTFLDFEDGNGLTAITGPNGAGKSFLLEALPAAGYGEFPSRTGSMLRHVTWNHLGPALIEVVAEIENTRYTFTRRLKKTAKGGTQEAYITAEGPEDAKPRAIAGPKPSEVNERTAVILGNKKLFLASTFASQQSVGDLIEALPADRKMIIAGMMGSDYLLQISEQAKIQRGLEDEQEWKVRYEIDQAEKYLEENEKIPEMLKMAEKSAATLQVAEDEVQDRIKHQEEALRLISAKIESLAGAAEEARDMAVTLKGQEVELGALHYKLSALQRILEGEPVARENLALLEKLEGHVEARARAMERHGNLRGKHSDKCREIDRAKDTILKMTYSRDAHMGGYTDRIKILQAVIQKHIARADTLQESADLAKKPIYQHEVCAECPLLSHSRAAEETIHELRDAVVKVERDILALKKERGDYEIGSGKELAEAEEGLKPLEADRVLLEIEGKKAAADLKVYDGLEDDIHKLKPVRKIMEDIVKAKAQVILKKAAIETAEEQIQSTMRKIADLNESAAELPSVEEECQAMTSVLLQEGEALRSAREHRITAENQAAVYRAKAEEMAAKTQALPTLKADQAALLKSIGHWQYLQDAFSKDGIPQFVVDSAMPHIDSCLDRVMELFEGRFKMELVTQRLTQEGELREVLDIMITSDLGVVADIKDYSGGEQKLLKTLLRIALALFQAQRRGRRNKVFFADEAFDQLDAEFSRGLQEVFRMMASDLNQVILASHNDTIIAEVDQVFAVERGADGSSLAEG